ncbi:hypothetical protein [Paracoccus litorisediminis]|uniref:Uncharacterized protein n=1 Tax=Paracoccus litorisediminis TaxID=2006130 RepID=A0A844HMJ3_9RHOB|nr:hypothetical protein [Paracoccus litorisediminis]MTH61140.1 hypothetical protein [Paracoccus litorisediminis]
MADLLTAAAQGKILEGDSLDAYRRWGWKADPHMSIVQQAEDRERFAAFHNEGIDLFHKYAGQLLGVTDRAQVELIRAQMRGDLSFIEHWQVIERVAVGSEWWRGVMRSEARRAEREGEELLARIAADKKAQEERDIQEMKANPVFGMF